MDPVFNPYAPGAGRRPTTLVGRDEERRSWFVALDRIQHGRTVQPVVLYGLRGVGKTVLLSSFAAAAREKEWIVAQVEAGIGKPLRETLGEALHTPLTDLARPSAGRRVLRALKTALTFKASYDTAGTWSFGLDLKDAPGGGADTGNLEMDLGKLIRDLSEAADEEHTGVAILVDEAQELTMADIVALCAIAHAAGQQSWRCLFALAGLPSLPRVLTEAKSYAERLFIYTKVEHLQPEVARAALVEPAAAENVRWDEDAVDHVVEQAGGYPYFLQQFGQDTWNVATGRTLTLADARVGVAVGRATLDNGFFRARWDRATQAEKRYLTEMAADGDARSSSGDVAARLGRAPSSLGPVRANLISKGLVYAPEHGVIAFTVPGMADFIRRQPVNDVAG